MKKLLSLVLSFVFILFLSGCRYFDSTMPQTYVYFDSFQEIKDHIYDGNMTVPMPELTEEEYEKKCETKELKNVGLHYRNYIYADIREVDEKITDGCYVIQIYRDKVSPSKIVGTMPLYFVYNIENGEGLYRIVLRIRSSSESQLEKLNELKWVNKNNDEIDKTDYYDADREYRIASGYKPKKFIEFEPSTQYNVVYGIGDMIVCFNYDNDQPTDNNLAFENKIKQYIQNNLNVLTVK